MKLLTLLSTLAASAGAVVIEDACRESTFKTALGDNATIEKIEVVAKGQEYGEGAANVAYPKNPANLPELCAVTVRVNSSSTSSFRFGLFLPTEWNSDFLAVGNGGFAGGIAWLHMGPRKY
jgi:hypothetical protein